MFLRLCRCMLGGGALLAVSIMAPPAPAFAGATQPCKLPDFDRHYFNHPTKIDNPWFPLTPGSQFTYQGRSNRGGGLLPHRVITTVTALTKVINGVRTRVVLDLDINNEKLVEQELAFFAQGNGGNVWSMGEYPEERENGKLHAHDVWIAGVKRAKAGVLVPGTPRLGEPAFVQGFAPTIEFFDCGKVVDKGDYKCFHGHCARTVVIDEFDPSDETGGHQRKTNLKGIGLIRVDPGAGDEEQEVLQLISIKHLNMMELKQLHQEIRTIDRRAYRLSKDVYGTTPPIE